MVLLNIISDRQKREVTAMCLADALLQAAGREIIPAANASSFEETLCYRKGKWIISFNYTDNHSTAFGIYREG